MPISLTHSAHVPIGISLEYDVQQQRHVCHAALLPTAQLLLLPAALEAARPAGSSPRVRPLVASRQLHVTQVEQARDSQDVFLGGRHKAALPIQEWFQPTVHFGALADDWEACGRGGSEKLMFASP